MHFKHIGSLLNEDSIVTSLSEDYLNKITLGFNFSRDTEENRPSLPKVREAANLGVWPCSDLWRFGSPVTHLQSTM